MTAINSKNQYDNRATDTGHSGLLYLMIGAGIGAAAALLLAPKSGADLRGDVTDLAQRGYDQTADLARRVKEQSTGLYNTVREKAGDVLDLAGSKASDAKAMVDEAVDNVSDETASALHQLETKFGRKDSNVSHKSSNIV